MDPAANVALLIFPMYGAAVFFPQIFVLHVLAHFDAQNYFFCVLARKTIVFVFVQTRRIQNFLNVSEQCFLH